jgi:hypothetical protein
VKVLLHIGQSKTGTSSIQSFLTRHRATLLKQGFAYPSPVVAGMEIDLGSHNVVADALVGRMRHPKLTAEQYFSQFFAHANKHDCHTMILSAEHFFGGEPRIWASPSLADYRDGYRRKLETLKGLLGDHEVEIIVFLRPQVDWISSVTAQNITHGPLEGRQFGQYDDWEKFRTSRPLLTYSERLTAWDTILKPAKFHVVPYVRKQLAEGNSVAEFLQRAGIVLPASADQRAVEANITVPREDLEVKKALNQQPRSRSEEAAIIRCLRDLSQDSPHGSTYRIADDVVQAIIADVEEDNALISSRFMDGRPFPAMGSYGDKELIPLSQAEIHAASARFEQTFNNPRYRLQQAGFGFLSFARGHARPLHALLHQAKRARRWLVNR